MRTEKWLFHPKCHKDKDNGMDASNVDTSMEEVSSPVKKEVKEEEEKEQEILSMCNDDATSNELTSASTAEETVIKTEPTVPSLADNDVAMEDVDIKDKEEEAAVKVELKEDTDANDNNLDSKESVKEENDATTETVKTEEVMETETTETGEEPAEDIESEEKLKHSDSLLEDKEEKESLAVPVVPAKVVISSSGGSDILCRITPVIVSVMMKVKGGHLFLISSLCHNASYIVV